MNSLFIPTALAEQQYDRCWDCPLLGLIPEKERKEGNRKGYVCIGRMRALTSKGVKIRASKRDAKHPLHRPCDSYYDIWAGQHKRIFNLSKANYQRYRLPFEQLIQTTIDFD